MSDFQPLPIPFELEIPISSRRLLAEEVFDLLERKGEDEIEILEGFAYPIKVTERVDAVTTENGELALRLRQRPSVETDEDSRVTGPSGRYYVACIEIGSYSPLIDIPEDDDFTWASYLTIIVDGADLNEVRVLGCDGIELQDSQIDDALKTVKFIRHEMRNDHFEAGISALTGTMIDRTRQLDENNQIGFVSEDFLELSFCGHCGVNVPCAHNPETIN